MDANASPDDDVSHAQSRALLDFIDASPTPFHAVAGIAARLTECSFGELQEGEAWRLAPGGRYFVTRNGSALIAFSMGTQPPAEAGFKIIGAHTDSPCLKLKPDPVYHKNGYTQMGVEVYGGVLLSTWTDRDLSLAGRIVLGGAGGALSARLFKAEAPLLRIPQLAIHLQREVNTKGLTLNPQTHLPPVFSLNAAKPGDAAPPLKQWLAAMLPCAPEEILNWDLSLYDCQKSVFAGPNREFLFAPRLDNLASCHAAAQAFISAAAPDRATRVLAFFDNEEVGSGTAQGAGSPFLRDALERAAGGASGGGEALARAAARSFMISADMAHAVHPNYAEMHDAQHMPLLNKGPVIKANASQRYATDGWTAARFERLCQRAGVAPQRFVIRSDLACGSTIGPVTAASLGIQTVDVGNPMLSMHSIREMAGSRDHWEMIRVFQEFFRAE